jgi:hypothetical protein
MSLKDFKSHFRTFVLLETMSLLHYFEGAEAFNFSPTIYLSEYRTEPEIHNHGIYIHRYRKEMAGPMENEKGL